MKHLQYTTQGTCSILIDVTADDDNVIQNVAFLGGCNGNTQGICRLVTGQKIDGRKLTFKVSACDDEGIIGEGTHIRYIVDIEHFMAKLK